MPQSAPTAGRVIRESMIHGGAVRWISVDEAEAITGRSKWSWRRSAYGGDIGSSKVGRRLFLRLDEVQAFMAAGYRPAVNEQGRGK